MLYEVGDAKAEAKTSQALREGLDVRATKSAANAQKKKKKKGGAVTTAKAKEAAPEEPPKVTEKEHEKPQVASPERTPERSTASTGRTPSPPKMEPESPPSLPKLADEEIKAGMVHPHSPEAMQFRKRRRMRALACGADKFFPDFCPPRADLGRTEDGVGKDDASRAESVLQHSPMRRASSIDEEEGPKEANPGCTAAALEMVAGAVAGGFCFGPTK